ncbi:MAG TPA: hypothetical protein VFG04_13775 [Planctomycetaceae bacterium]|nr:hypothetical protein [Planctomycetaceae bacterium]
MSRKITFAVVAVTLVLAGSNAFAKGGSKAGSHATHPAHRPNVHPARRPQATVQHIKGGRFEGRIGHRSGWGYEFATYPVAVAEAPVVETVVDDSPVDAVIDAPVTDEVMVDAPAVDAPVYVEGYFGGHGHREFLNHGNHGRTGGKAQGGKIQGGKGRGGHGGRGGRR